MQTVKVSQKVLSIKTKILKKRVIKSLTVKEILQIGIKSLMTRMKITQMILKIRITMIIGHMQHVLLS